MDLDHFHNQRYMRDVTIFTLREEIYVCTYMYNTVKKSGILRILLPPDF